VPLNWNDAVDFAVRKNMFLPTLDQVNNTYIEFWTAETFFQKTTYAYTNKGKAVSKLKKKIVVLVKHQGASQQIQNLEFIVFRNGDL